MIALFLHDATMLPVEAPKSLIAMFQGFPPKCRGPTGKLTLASIKIDAATKKNPKQSTRLGFLSCAST
jgi:hypothetical protein